MLISYPLKEKYNRIDSWRLFEASWLLANGQPTTRLVCLTLENKEVAIDTFELKKRLNQGHFKKYPTPEAWLDSLLDQESTLFSKEFFFKTIPWWQNGKSNYLTHQMISDNIRFICPSSGQPFAGQLLIESLLPIDLNELNWILLDKRSQSFTSWEYADRLFEALSINNNQLILSLHLGRRGGISYQGIRSSLNLTENPSLWLARSSME